ncbi:MAG: class III signal peptide-containing protein [Candidatus Bilamarchaeaceae archaeon]
MNKKGQVSAEMLILLAVVVAIVAIAATYLMNAGKAAGEQVESQANITLSRVGELSKGDVGDVCAPSLGGSDCKSGVCGPDGRCT